MSSLQGEIAELAERFPSNTTFLLYAMGLHLRTMDYQHLYQECVLDGPGDKKVDFFCLDLDAGLAIVAQSYQSLDWDKPNPPVNKASDLNTARTWLLDSDIEEIPTPSIRAAAQQLRDAIDAGQVHTLELAYVHNLPHSADVDRELDVIQRSAQQRLDAWPRTTGTSLSARVLQVSRNEVDQWRDERDSPIRVKDQISFHSSTTPQLTEGAEWRSSLVTLTADQLAALAATHGTAIYSANVRDYLGTRASSRNINSQIAKTALERPKDFWVFNNGVTLVTGAFTIRDNHVDCQGVAVVNGAQTVGVLAQVMQKADLNKALVLVRIVHANNQDILQDVIRYNNTQNPIHPWELRAVDSIQTTIKQNLEKQYGLTYQLRRGQVRWTASEIHFEKLAPWVCAFHGEPQTAHRNRPDIFDNDARYSRLFSQHTRVENLLFIYRLGQAVASVKDELRAAVDSATASEADQLTYRYYRYGVFTYVLLYLCAEALRAILNGGADFAARATMTSDCLIDQTKAMNALKPLVKFVLAPVRLALAKGDDPYALLKSSEGVANLADRARVAAEEILALRPDAFDEIKSAVALL